MKNYFENTLNKTINKLNQFLKQKVDEKCTFEDTLKKLKTLFT